MTEKPPLPTKEELVDLRDMFTQLVTKDRADKDAPKYKAVIDDIFDLAERGLACTPRPISDAPKDEAMLVFYKNELGRTYQRLRTREDELTDLESTIAAQATRIKELEAGLQDGHVVHINMLRGVIAKPSVRDIIHLYGHEAILKELGNYPAENETRPCTCHPDDNPPVPCQHKYALQDCRAAQLAGKGERKTDVALAAEDRQAYRTLVVAAVKSIAALGFEIREIGK